MFPVNKGFFVSTKQEVAVEVAEKDTIIETFNLVCKNDYEKMPQFKKARRVKSSDTTYIVYYVWNVQKGKQVRKRLFVPKEYKTEAEKNAFLDDRIKAINKLLVQGYHIDTEKSKGRKKERLKEVQEVQEVQKVQKKSLKEPMLIRDAIEKLVILRIAKKYHKRGVSFFKNTMLLFVKWGEEQKKSVKYINDITFHVIQDYQMYLLTELKNESKTHNNSLGVISAFYNDCKKQEWIKGDNPLEKFDNLPTNYGTKNKPYTNEEVAKMKAYILKNDPYLWVIISFIYYSFLRPVELRRLKISDIDLKSNQIRIAVEQSKTKRYDIIPIAPALRKIIEKMNLQQYGRDFFVFSGCKTPSLKPMGENYMSKHFRVVKKEFGFGKDYTLYGFKHTGNVNWYKAEKDIIKIQKMNRHTSVKTTERYLKSMGLLEDENAVAMLPEI